SSYSPSIQQGSGGFAPGKNPANSIANAARKWTTAIWSSAYFGGLAGLCQDAPDCNGLTLACTVANAIEAMNRPWLRGRTRPGAPGRRASAEPGVRFMALPAN